MIKSSETKTNTSQRSKLILLGLVELPIPLLAFYFTLQLLDYWGSGYIYKSYYPFFSSLFFISVIIIALIQIIVGFLNLDKRLDRRTIKYLINSGIILFIITFPIFIWHVINYELIGFNSHIG